jgi:hypothetical protein
LKPLTIIRLPNLITNEILSRSFATPFSGISGTESFSVKFSEYYK